MDLPREAIVVKDWEVKLGWSAENRAWAVMILVKKSPENTLSLALHPDVSEALGKGLLDGASMARTHPPHQIGSAH